MLGHLLVKTWHWSTHTEGQALVKRKIPGYLCLEHVDSQINDGKPSGPSSCCHQHCFPGREKKNEKAKVYGTTEKHP